MQPNLITQKLETILINEDGTVTHEIIERDQPLDTSDHHEFHDQQWVVIRRQRDLLLAQSDWVSARAHDLGMPVPTDWATYRQALRDITEQENPFFITWPTKPENVVFAASSADVTPPQESI